MHPDPGFRPHPCGYRPSVTHRAVGHLAPTGPRVLADRYVLGERIARGGTARVHEATDTRLGRRVAVKLLDQDLAESASPAGRDRFVQECRTSAGFTHPRAVTVYDAGEDGDDLFLVMELVEGPSLARHLADRGPLPIVDVVRLSTQLADALGAAHAAGIAHRDVKPANVLLDASGDVKLADFGIARRFHELDAAVTATGLVVGTPRYLAPEQAAGAPAGPPADVYALGLVIVEMLTARPPVGTAVGDLHRERPDLPDRLASLLSSMLTADPDQRPADAAEVARALRDTTAPRRSPVAAGVPSVPDVASHEASATAADDDLPTAAIRTTVLPGGDTVVMPTATHRPAPIGPKRRSGRPGNEGRRGSGSRLGFMAPALAAAALVAILVVGATLGDQTPPIDPATAAGVDTDVSPDTAAPDQTDGDPDDDAAPGPPREGGADPSDAAMTLEEFAAIVDVHEFELALRLDPSIAGPAGEELADALRAVIETGPRPRQAAAADDLRERVRDWVDDGQLDGGFARLVDDLLVPISDHPSNRG